MKKVLFVCHGNICRSPMAEFVLRDMVTRENMQDQVFVASAGQARRNLEIQSILLHNAFCENMGLIRPASMPEE